MRVVVQIATQTEWSSLINLVGDRAEPGEALGNQVITVRQGETEIIAVHGGVGKVHAAAMAQYAILTWKPALVAVLGTSGAINPELKVLDIVVANRTIVYDIDSGLDGGTNETIRTLTTDLQVPALPVPHHVGTVLTGDRDVTRHNIDSLRARFDGLIADWESGAIARVCKLNNVPCMVLRGVSDTPHADGADQFDSYIRNTPVVMNRLWHVLTEHILG